MQHIPTQAGVFGLVVIGLVQVQVVSLLLLLLAPESTSLDFPFCLVRRHWRHQRRLKPQVRVPTGVPPAGRSGPFGCWCRLLVSSLEERLTMLPQVSVMVVALGEHLMMHSDQASAPRETGP